MSTDNYPRAKLDTPKRFKNAATAQSGACNPRPIANALVEAIDECRAEGFDPANDPAVFLILHQLTFMLTNHDIAMWAGESARYIKDMAAVEAALKEG